MSISTIINKQNPDGGWSYVRGKSWTEPTAYAVMALLAAAEHEAAQCGLRWIAGMQRADGGLPPQEGVEQSTWVTALIALLPPETVGAAIHARAIQWLMDASGRETSTLVRARERLLGHPPPADQKFPGWPWVPGAAAWVGPTSVAILALEKAHQRTPAAAIRARIEDGRNFLLARMCQEGGWNHGSARPLGYDSRPYPETTGMALAALRGVRSAQVDRSIDAARSFLSVCRSADALNWLRLGLLAHGRLPAGYVPAAPVVCRTLPETAVSLLVADAEKGRSVFWT